MMTYDGLVLAAVVAELRRGVEGGVVQGVRQHNDTDFTLEIRSAGRPYLLFMSVHARFARTYLTAASLPVPQTPPRFCALLRKHIRGSFLTAVEQVDFDRVLGIRTEAPDGNRNTLVLELMGKHSNLILLSDTGRILGAAKNVTSAVSRYRQVLPGRDYVPPPAAGKADPIGVSRDGFDSLWREGLGEQPSADEVKRWLVPAFTGFGPFLAEEIARRAGSARQDDIWLAFQDIRQIVLNERYAPVLVTDDRGLAVYGYPIPVKQFPPTNQHGRLSMNETLDTLFRDLLRRDQFESERAEVERAIRRAIAWREQTVRDLEKARAEGEKAERYKQFGELILASAGSIPRGGAAARVTDYYDPELREVDVPLDEKLSAKENAERYFRRYRKAVDGAQAAEDRGKEIETETKILQAAFERLPGAASVENLRALRQMLTERGLLRAEQQPARGGREEPEFGGAKIRRIRSSDGLEILYGENSEANDYLTKNVARPNDYWLHARSVTGSHVIIRTGNRPGAVPPRTIREAAEIAARNSEAKHSGLVAVDWTLRKYVRKPRGAPAGFAVYTNEKTIDVTPAAR